MAIFAGVRNLNIGGDMNTYVNSVFYSSSSSTSFHSALSVNPGIEFGYVGLNYAISKFTTNENVYLFILGLIVYGLTYIGFTQFRKFNQVTVSLFFYLMLLYCLTFTLVRQSISCTLVFLGIGLFINNKKKTAIVLVLSSGLFHSSGFVGISILFFLMILERIKQKAFKKIIILLIITSLMVYIFGDLILSFLVSHNLISLKFSSYLNEGNASMFNVTEGVSIGNLYRLFFIFLFFCIIRELKKNKIALFIFSIVVFDFIFTILAKGAMGLVVSRVSYYFTWLLPVAYGFPIRQAFNKQSKVIVYFVAGVIVIFVFIHVLLKSPVGVTGQQLYPYNSSIFDINN
ncbi:EpsG family protein [Lactococcus lactis subsp. lactis]|jgi:hypothetical protein|nr:EpsG family protein [Lactococcus lactis]